MKVTSQAGRAFMAGAGTVIASAIAVAPMSQAWASPTTDVPGTECLADTSHATVDLTVESLHPYVVNGLDLANFNAASCEGATVQVDLRGSRTGDPNKPARELLSSLDSTKSACAGALLPVPLTIHDGAIHLATCDTATAGTSPGRPADLHDLTLLVIKIAGAETSISVGSGGGGKCTSIQDSSSCVLGEKVTRSLPATGSSSGNDSSGLPFTGAWAALTLGLGASGLLAGILLTVIARRRTGEVQP